MEKLDEAKIVARFAACENKEDLRECESRFYKEDQKWPYKLSPIRLKIYKSQMIK